MYLTAFTRPWRRRQPPRAACRRTRDRRLSRYARILYRHAPWL